MGVSADVTRRTCDARLDRFIDVFCIEGKKHDDPYDCRVTFFKLPWNVCRREKRNFYAESTILRPSTEDDCQPIKRIELCKLQTERARDRFE